MKAAKTAGEIGKRFPEVFQAHSRTLENGFKEKDYGKRPATAGIRIFGRHAPESLPKELHIDLRELREFAKRPRTGNALAPAFSNAYQVAPALH